MTELALCDIQHITDNHINLGKLSAVSIDFQAKSNDH